MKRTTIFFYSIMTFALIIGGLALIKLPAIVFVGVEDEALTFLLYFTCIFVILKSVIDISHFFLEKLGLYSVIHLENRKVFFEVEQLRKEMNLQQEHNKEIWTDLYKIDLRIRHYEKEQDNNNT